MVVPRVYLLNRSTVGSNILVVMGWGKYVSILMLAEQGYCAAYTATSIYDP
jgi:hypothetical protein